MLDQTRSYVVEDAGGRRFRAAARAEARHATGPDAVRARRANNKQADEKRGAVLAPQRHEFVRRRAYADRVRRRAALLEVNPDVVISAWWEIRSRRLRPNALAPPAFWFSKDQSMVRFRHEPGRSPAEEQRELKGVFRMFGPCRGRDRIDRSRG